MLYYHYSGLSPQGFVTTACPERDKVNALLIDAYMFSSKKKIKSKWNKEQINSQLNFFLA